MAPGNALGSEEGNGGGLAQQIQFPSKTSEAEGVGGQLLPLARSWGVSAQDTGRRAGGLSPWSPGRTRGVVLLNLGAFLL